MASSPPVVVIEECRSVLRVFSDGSVVRSLDHSFPVPVVDDGSVDWRDALFSSPHALHLRLYRPRHHNHTNAKLPVFFYIHGGGFCIGSRAWPNCHNYCLRLASDLHVLVVSPDYRLAPEHPLPAAIDDAAAAVRWLRDAAAEDPWVAASADLDRVFLSGDSSGGNAVHHLAVRFGSEAGREEIEPVRIRGLVLLMPFFGGTEWTRSEAECPVDAFLNRDLSERFWRLALPAGSTLDHPLVNPFGPEAPDLRAVEVAPMVVVVGGKDLLRDRAAEYAAKLRAPPTPVELVEFVDQQHGFFTIEPWSEPANELMRKVKRFVDQHGRDASRGSDPSYDSY